MAPRKRASGQDDVPTVVTRVTRSSSAGKVKTIAVLPKRAAPKAKKAKTSEKETSKSEKSEKGNKEAPAVEENTEEENKEVPAVEEENTEEENKEVPAVEENTEKEKVTVEQNGDVTKRTVIIEHCKQCTSFKKRAEMVKDGLEQGVPGVNVILNPEKPRKGCFEIREDGGETFISHLGMKRPFQPMKDLNMEQVIADIIGKIK